MLSTTAAHICSSASMVGRSAAGYARGAAGASSASSARFKVFCQNVLAALSASSALLSTCARCGDERPLLVRAARPPITRPPITRRPSTHRRRPHDLVDPLDLRHDRGDCVERPRSRIALEPRGCTEILQHGASCGRREAGGAQRVQGVRQPPMASAPCEAALLHARITASEAGVSACAGLRRARRAGSLAHGAAQSESERRAPEEQLRRRAPTVTRPRPGQTSCPPHLITLLRRAADQPP